MIIYCFAFFKVKWETFENYFDGNLIFDAFIYQTLTKFHNFQEKINYQKQKHSNFYQSIFERVIKSMSFHYLTKSISLLSILYEKNCTLFSYSGLFK